MQNTLNITPLENQFGYSATPFGNTTTANLYANAFNVPYLQQRGMTTLMAIIDERFRKMLMMDYATKEGQNNQGFLEVI